MTTPSILLFIAIAGFVWGGLLLILFTAVRKERAQSNRADRAQA